MSHARKLPANATSAAHFIRTPRSSVVALITFGGTRLKAAALDLERSTLCTETVKRGQMLRQVRRLGTLIPQDVRVVATPVEGRVARGGMAHRMKHYPSQLSGGQQQRVAVARAVAGNPSMLFADEPTGNLDSTNGEAVMNLLRELHQGGATIRMVTHDPRYARYAD